MDFKREFDKDPDACVRDYCGISTLSIRPFLSRRELIERMFELGREHGLTHPYNRLEVTLQQKDPDYEHLIPERLHWIERPVLNSLGKPVYKDNKPVTERALHGSLRYAHIDLSKTGDATGLCVVHTVDTKKCSRMQMIDGKFSEVWEEKPIIWVDLLLRVIPPPHGEIDIPRVRGVLYSLHALGMEFGKITFDQWGSQESVKSLKEQGYTADNFSLDINTEGYEALKDAIYDQRLYCYDFPLLQRELAQLENTGRKIDHPDRGSKDLADALAGAVFNAEEGWRKGQGVGGLFAVGEVERPGDVKPSELRARALAKLTEGGEALSDAEENALLFDDLENL